MKSRHLLGCHAEGPAEPPGQGQKAGGCESLGAQKTRVSANEWRTTPGVAAKDTSAQRREGWSGADRGARGRGARAQPARRPSPPPPAAGPGQPAGPSKVAGTAPHSRAGGGRPTAARRRGRGRGGRPASGTRDPGAASSFTPALAAFPTRPSPATHSPSPHLRGRLGAGGWRGIRAGEAAAGGGGTSWRGRSGVQAPSASALGRPGGNGVTLHPGSWRGRGGAGHVPRSAFATPPPRPRNAANVAAWLLAPRSRAPEVTWPVARASEIPARVRLPP